MRRRLRTVIGQAHELVASVLGPGDLAVDATAGNGHDTVHLARCVGGAGLVVGVDRSARAIEATRERVDRAGVGGRCRLVCRGHEELAEILAGQAPGRVPRVVMFNLGYLPGDDMTTATASATTLAALAVGLELLPPGGLLTVILYSGHPGGAEEARAVVAWASGVGRRRGAGPTGGTRALWYRYLAADEEGPSLVAVEKG